jgi:predicted nucleotidyltransferase
MVMLILQDCIQKLSDFKRLFAQKYGITRLGIFGSVARNEHTENSDIDIVVEVKKPTLQLMYELNEALKQLFNCEVDLVRFRDSLRPLLKSNIQRDVIYV